MWSQKILFIFSTIFMCRPNPCAYTVFRGKTYPLLDLGGLWYIMWFLWSWGGVGVWKYVLWVYCPRIDKSWGPPPPLKWSERFRKLISSENLLGDLLKEFRGFWQKCLFWEEILGEERVSPLHCSQLQFFLQKIFFGSCIPPTGDSGGRGPSHGYLSTSHKMAVSEPKLLGNLLKDLGAFWQVWGSTQEAADFSLSFW